MADWDADAITKAYEREHPKKVAVCTHGVPIAGYCPWCRDERGAEPTDAERERRLRALMPLIDCIAKHTEPYEWERSAEKIERLLELVEHPRRKVTEDA